MRAVVVKRTEQIAIPTWGQAFRFEAKAWGFRLQRLLRDVGRGPRRHARSDALAEAPVLAESVTPLWSNDDASQPLVAGKVHNLRLAVREFRGVVVPAGETLGFWRQVGRVTGLRGYANGRELREGCLVPSVGGGLCQLSNAIYDTALRAGLEIVERHRHTRIIAGSLAEHDRDAVVFWNYIDLRLRAASSWRLEAWLDSECLHVRIRGLPTEAPARLPLVPAARNAMPAENDCGRCGQTACHRHVPDITATSAMMARTWLVDEDWPEFADYRRASFGAEDRIVAVRNGWRMRIAAVHARAVRRWRLWKGDPLPQARLRGHRLLARALARSLGAADTRLVVPQSVLPYLWEAGELQGRRFDVWMTALPMQDIQHRLELACQRHPESPTLRDFRADETLVRAEAEALAHATRWITPHAGILVLAGERGHALPWRMPTPVEASSAAPGPARVMLASSALARKGACELRGALRDMRVQLLLPPGAEESPGFWSGIEVVRVASMMQGIRDADVVVLPAWVEHQPRALLLALASGKAVVATAACGVVRDDRWRCVEAGDVAGLRAAIHDAVAKLGGR